MDLEEAYSELIKSDDSALRTASPPTYRSVSVAFCDALILPKPPVAAKLQQIPEISKPQGEGRPSPVDRSSAHEYTYDPIVRYNALNRLFREPRGAKSVEHKEVLRQSNPCYGSLAPSLDRPSAHEYTYDPLARYAALAPLLRPARGEMGVAHKEVLRQSNPCYGSLAPSLDRPSAHEYTYDPLARYAALAPLLRPARGAKAFEHLRHLRTDFASRPNANPKFDDEWQQLEPEFGALRAVSSISSELWRRYEGEDELAEMPARQARPTLLRGLSRLYSDDRSDSGRSERSSNESERSAARTALERCSNDTALSLADMEDIINNKAGFDSGEWSADMSPGPSPRLDAKQLEWRGRRGSPPKSLELPRALAPAAGSAEHDAA